MGRTRAGPSIPKKGGGENEKVHKRFVTLPNQMMLSSFGCIPFFKKIVTIKIVEVFARAARNFRKKSVKSTIFELQQSFLYIFGVAQNF